MNFTRAIFVFVLILAATFAAQAAPVPNKTSGIVRGFNYAFSVKAPEGWALDESAGLRQGFAAVFYPKDSSWSESPAVMYINSADKSQRQNADIKKVMAYDLSQFKKSSPVLQASKPLPLITKTRRRAYLRTFTGDLAGNLEAVAYIDEPKRVILVVLSARSPEDYAKAFPAFQDLVRSYHYMR
jgi:hypothetical protein